MLIPIRHLCLVGQHLVDQHLDLLAVRLLQLDHLDIGFNKFEPDSLLNFLLAINRTSKKEIKLRSLSLAGNSLKTSSERYLAQTLLKLLIKPALVHLDLSLTQVSEAVVSKVM